MQDFVYVAVCHIYIHNSNVAFQTQSNECEEVRIGVLSPGITCRGGNENILREVKGGACVTSTSDKWGLKKENRWV